MHRPGKTNPFQNLPVMLLTEAALKYTSQCIEKDGSAMESGGDVKPKMMFYFFAQKKKKKKKKSIRMEKSESPRLFP